MKVLTVYVSTEDDMETAEAVADALHALVREADVEPFDLLTQVVSVDAEVKA